MKKLLEYMGGGSISERFTADVAEGALGVIFWDEGGVICLVNVHIKDFLRGFAFIFSYILSKRGREKEGSD